MPGHTCHIREWMLYSSSKNPLLEIVETQVQMDVIRKIETDNEDKLTADFLYEFKCAHRQSFGNQKVLQEKGELKD